MIKNKLFALFAIGFLVFVGLVVSTQFFPEKIKPTVLRVGVLPDEDSEVLRKRYAPLLKYLSESIGIDTRLTIPSDYDDLSRLFNNSEIDLAYFGGLTFVRESIRSDAEPLVMRDIDSHFVSYFLAGFEQGKLQISDFEGKRFSFGSDLSTSGHLMPRHFMKSELQIEPENFFSSIDYSGSHDKTVFLVRDNMVDLGVVNSSIFEKMIVDGRITENALQIVWETPPYVDYVWAVQKHLDEMIKNRLRDAFLGLDSNSLVHESILRNLGASHFLPAGRRDFLSLESTARNLGMLEVSPE